MLCERDARDMSSTCRIRLDLAIAKLWALTMYQSQQYSAENEQFSKNIFKVWSEQHAHSKPLEYTSFFIKFRSLLKTIFNVSKLFGLTYYTI